MILFWKQSGRRSGGKGKRKRENRERKGKGEMEDLQVHLFQFPHFTSDDVTHLFQTGPSPFLQSCQMEERDLNKL